jgi:hypothetical protein
MDEWIQIFKTGKHVDSSGQEREWGKEDLDQIVSSYAPEKDKAPVVIGHPKDNAPAYGWVEALKREGNILFAKLKNLAPEFVDMVKKGLFKKRSISLYPNLSLRHVGFLGASPPAIKGLEDIRFQEGEQKVVYLLMKDEIKNYWEGGTNVRNQNFENPSEEWHRRAMEILRDPSKARKFSEKGDEITSYKQALEIVLQEDPALGRRYYQSLIPPRSQRRAVLESSHAAGERINKLVIARMRENRAFTYKEALQEVLGELQMENPQLIADWRGQKSADEGD